MTECVLSFAVASSSLSSLSEARVKLMLRSLNLTGRSPLHVSAYHCKPEVVKFLVDLGADKKQQDRHGNTAGRLAERAGRRDSKEIIDGESSSFSRMLHRSLAVAKGQLEETSTSVLSLAG